MALLRTCTLIYMYMQKNTWSHEVVALMMNLFFILRASWLAKYEL